MGLQSLLEHHVAKRFFVSSPRVFNSANCALSFASAIEPGLNPSPNEKVISYFFHDV